jgi:hypothetical protein
MEGLKVNGSDAGIITRGWFSLKRVNHWKVVFKKLYIKFLSVC